MNREIKFRAWCKEGKYMVYDTHSIKVLERYDHENCMQYIGLKGKNGKEVYEKDFVSVHQFLFDGNEIEKEWIGEIVYMEEFNCCGFGLKVISGEFSLEHTGYETYEEMPPIPLSDIYGLHEESFEVIGNIFENSELLNS